MYGGLLAFAIAIVIVAIGMAISRTDARVAAPRWWWPITTLTFVTGVWLIGTSADLMGGS